MDSILFFSMRESSLYLNLGIGEKPERCVFFDVVDIIPVGRIVRFGVIKKRGASPCALAVKH